MRGPQTFEQFMSVRYWPQLDGLRTISILFVFIGHMGDHWWIKFEGSMGVVLFFVISGFLITSLLIREEHRSGRISLSSFYIRRAFRIIPLYALALTITAVLVLVFHQGAGREGFADRLPFLATFNGDLVAYGTFVHSWSIGVEEKFYILWPLLAFAIIGLRKHRTALVSVLIPAAIIAAYIPATQYFGLYTGILLGCGLSVLMHSRRGFAIAQAAARPAAGTALFLLAVAAFVLNYWTPGADQIGNAHVVFAVCATLAFPFLVIGGNWLTATVGWKPLAYIGTRTYGIYLFHPLCIDVVGRVIPQGQDGPVGALSRFLLSALLAYAVAEVLYRIFEGPLIKIGRQLARKVTAARRAPLPVDTGRDVPTDRTAAAD